MSLNPRVCKKSYKVHIPMMGKACEFWLITVTDEQSITNPDKDHAYLTDDGKLFVFNGDSLVRVNCDICFTQEEREKLEGIEERANKYVLPVASSTELGGVLLGYTQNGRNYPITKDTKGNIYVNVPWEEYQLPKATDNALGGIKTGYKQNGKFYPIKTDTDGNAYVQVPWEDTNTVYEVVSKTSNGLMPMLPTENADKKFLNGQGQWIVPETGSDINPDEYVKKSGDTMTGDLNMEADINFGSQKGMFKDQSNRLIIGDTEHHIQLRCMSKASVYNGTSGEESIVDTGDIVDNLSSTETKKPLSAAQGKALNDKINNVQAMLGTTKLYYVSKVIQISSGTSVTTVYTQDELKEMLGITEDSGFNNRITAAVINGAKNTQSANIVACNYEETTKALRIKCEDAQSGSLRVNLLIAFNAGIAG